MKDATNTFISYYKDLYSLVFISLISFNIIGVHADLLIILLKSSHVLSGLGELSLLHTLANIPVDEGSLGVHQVKLVVKSGPGLGNGGGVGEHTDGSLDLGKITSWDDGWWLIVDADLESCWTPVNKLDGSLALDGGNGGVDVLGDDVSPVEHAAGHVLAVSGVALHHGVGRLEAGISNLCYGELLVIGLLSGDDWSISDQREVDSWVRNQIGLELIKIHVESSIKPEGGCDGGHDLGDQTVQVGVGRTLNVQIPPADIVDGLVVDHEGTVRVFKGGVGAQGGVVGLYHGGGDLGSGVDGELQLGLLAIVHGQTLHQQGGEARSGSSSKRVEDEESLETSAVICQLPDSVKDKIHDLLANSVVTSGVVVGGVLLAADHLLGVEQLPVGSSPHLVNDGRFQ